MEVDQPSLPLRLQSPKSLGPGEAVSRERQRADALARHGKDRVAHRRKNRRESGFAEAGGGVVCFEEMNFDFGRHLVHADRGILVEIALDGAASVNGDFVGHDGAQPFDDSAADLIFSVGGIDDLAADVAGDPDFVDLDLLLGVDTEFDDFGELAAMRELEGNTHGGVFWKLSLAHAEFLRYVLEDLCD